ncbi:MAG: hypothetical protein CL489_11725 [Acidobacteria bacterium]|nr:hypothetical protein [Acidobacteriota bacterium]
MTLHQGDESKFVTMAADSVIGQLIKFLHEEGTVRFRANACQAQGCEEHAEWVVDYDIGDTKTKNGKKNVKVQLCKKHESAKKSFLIEVETE